MCISTCGSSLAHKEKPSSCPSNKRTEMYLMATVVLHEVVVNVAPSADCELSACQNVRICTLSASAGVTHVPGALCLSVHVTSFSSRAKLARTEA